jgi:hypothetical protein
LSSAPYPDVQAVVSALSSHVYGHVFRKSGFKKERRNFVRHKSGCVQWLKFQVSSFGSKNSSSFTANISISLRKIEEIVLGHELHDLDSRNSLIAIRSGRIVDQDYLDKWYNIDIQRDQTDVFNELTDDMMKINAFFELCSSEGGILSKLRSQQNLYRLERLTREDYVVSGYPILENLAKQSMVHAVLAKRVGSDVEAAERLSWAYVNGTAEQRAQIWRLNERLQMCPDLQ